MALLSVAGGMMLARPISLGRSSALPARTPARPPAPRVPGAGRGRAAAVRTNASSSESQGPVPPVVYGVFSAAEVLWATSAVTSPAATLAAGHMAITPASSLLITFLGGAAFVSGGALFALMQMAMGKKGLSAAGYSRLNFGLAIYASVCTAVVLAAQKAGLATGPLVIAAAVQSALYALVCGSAFAKCTTNALAASSAVLTSFVKVEASSAYSSVFSALGLGYAAWSAALLAGPWVILPQVFAATPDAASRLLVAALGGSLVAVVAALSTLKYAALAGTLGAKKPLALGAVALGFTHALAIVAGVEAGVLTRLCFWLAMPLAALLGGAGLATLFEQ